MRGSKKMFLAQSTSVEEIVSEWNSSKGDWLGLGSVTIKSLGMGGLRDLRERFPDRILVADLKTMDTGFMEMEMAALAGANIVTVSGIAGDETVMNAVEAGKKYGIEIMADILNAGIGRAKKLEDLGVNYIMCRSALIEGLRGGISVPLVSSGSGAEVEIIEKRGEISSVKKDRKKLSFNEPILQVALDLTELKDAIRVAELSSMGGVDWLEVGTPLIKCEGVKAVKALRERFPQKNIVADLKTLSNSSDEVTIAANAGADIVGISGASCDEEIVKAVESAKRTGSYIMADLIAMDNPVSRGVELEALGVDMLEFHISIDKQLRNESIPFSLVKDLCDSVRIPVAVAGGMKEETAPLALRSGARIVVVGGGITHAADPECATRGIKGAMEQKLQ